VPAAGCRRPDPAALAGANVRVLGARYEEWPWLLTGDWVFEAKVPLSDGHLCLELSCSLEEGSNYGVFMTLQDDLSCADWQSDGMFSVGPALPDADADSDVDLIDYAAFVDCADGPAVFPNPTPPKTGQDCLNAFDACGDGDVDLFDFGIVQRKFSASP
jgi:hypothetical protein